MGDSNILRRMIRATTIERLKNHLIMSRLINSMNVECLIPHLLTNKNTRSFTCKISQLAKHTPIYPSVLPHPYKTFAMVHRISGDPFERKILMRLNGLWHLRMIIHELGFLMKESEVRGWKNIPSIQLPVGPNRSILQVLKSDNAKEYFYSVLDKGASRT